MSDDLKHCNCGCIYAEVDCPNCNYQSPADCIEQLERERDEWKSRYEHHNHERLETLNLNAMQASKIGSLMNKIANLEMEIKDLRGKE